MKQMETNYSEAIWVKKSSFRLVKCLKFRDKKCLIWNQCVDFPPYSVFAKFLSVLVGVRNLIKSFTKNRCLVKLLDSYENQYVCSYFSYSQYFESFFFLSLVSLMQNLRRWTLDLDHINLQKSNIVLKTCSRNFLYWRLFWWKRKW